MKASDVKYAARLVQALSELPELEEEFAKDVPQNAGSRRGLQIEIGNYTSSGGDSDCYVEFPVDIAPTLIAVAREWLKNELTKLGVELPTNEPDG